MAKEVKKTSKEKKEKSSFFKDFKAELKRVSWPTFKQLVNNTIAVLTICFIIATIVFVLDFVFENLNKFGVEKLKALVTSSSSESSETEEHEGHTHDEVNVESETSNEAEESQVVGEDANTTTETNTVEAETNTTSN